MKARVLSLARLGRVTHATVEIRPGWLGWLLGDRRRVEKFLSAPGRGWALADGLTPIDEALDLSSWATVEAALAEAARDRNREEERARLREEFGDDLKPPG